MQKAGIKNPCRQKNRKQWQLPPDMCVIEYSTIGAKSNGHQNMSRGI
jgi:hypothetical protein